MEFQIDFNRGDNEDGLIALGATIKQVGEDYGFFIEIKDFAELEAFEKKVFADIKKEIKKLIKAGYLTKSK